MLRILRPFLLALTSLCVIAALIWILFPQPAESPHGESPAPPRTLVDEAARARIAESYGKLPLSFEANEGRLGGGVKFTSRGQGYNLYLTPTEAVLQLRMAEAKADGEKGRGGDEKEEGASLNVAPSPRRPVAPSPRQALLRMSLVGANSEPEMKGANELPGKSNYFIGNDPKKWRTNVSHFARVEYEAVYPGVDMVYYGNQRQLEYDFNVAPGADPGAIRMRFTGADKLEIDEQGDLVIQTKGGEVRQLRPIVYQETGDGARREIEGRYVLLADKGARRRAAATPLVGFELGEYDPTHTLVIDPILSYSTYFGGTNVEEGYGLTVDAAGMIYITGFTTSDNVTQGFPTTAGVFQPTTAGSQDAFVTKIDTTRSGAAQLVYSTYLGGAAGDIGFAIAVDGAGNAYLTGQTFSNDFPFMNAFDTTLSGARDAFVTKLNATGSALLYSTLYGGSGGRDFGAAIAVDAAGNAYIAGETNSGNLTIQNGFQTSFGGSFEDAFMAKFDTVQGGAGSLTYSTYIGGNADETGRKYHLALDAANIVHMVFSTGSTNIATQNPIQANNAGGNDLFLVKINTTQTGAASRLYASYFGGTGDDFGVGAAVDSAGNFYFAGRTDSTDLPLQNAFQSANGGGSDAFVTKLNGAGTALVYSTYLGGSGTEEPDGLALGPFDTVYVTGATTSDNFPVRNAVQFNRAGSNDVFVSKFDPSRSGSSSLVYSTYLGGGGDDQQASPGLGGRFFVDGQGSAYVVGGTTSNDFPVTSNAFQPAQNGFSRDAFVSKIAIGPGMVFTVNSTADTDDMMCTTNAGGCTLREAINAANVNAGADTIAFNIPGAGVQTINLLSALPDITGTLTIDGYTQPGASANTLSTGNNAVLLIELNGASVAGAEPGLDILAANCVVQGLVINRFNGGAAAAGIRVTNFAGTRIEGNFIGTNPTGAAAQANRNGVVINNAGFTTVGGTSPAGRNLISGNQSSGVVINAGSNSNSVLDNHIGTNAAGAMALANGNGVVVNSAANNAISGTLISGNTNSGISISGAAATNNTVRDSAIGTDAAGNSSIPNSVGVSLNNADNNTIGGTSENDRNLISGNSASEISIENGSDNNTVQGNYLGLAANGIDLLSNSLTAAVLVSDSANNQIGGMSSAARNVIASTSIGVWVVNAGATGNRIQGNFIGYALDGSQPGTISNGVRLAGGDNNLVGGLQPGAGNIIAATSSGSAGVLVDTGVGNRVLSNQIYSNDGLGIDLGDGNGTGDGVTPNDAGDADVGANNLQNFPVLTQAQFFGANTNIQGTLNSAPSTTYTLQFFSNPVCDPSGNGEGQFFLGSAQVTTDSMGNATFDITLSGTQASGEGIAATATDPSGNTSEFSNCQILALGPNCGSANFAAPVNFAAGTNPISVAVGDFNSDGNQDLAAANSNSNNVSVLLGNGAGGFGAASNFAAGTRPRSVAVGDFNGDGNQDLAVANEISNNISVLLGNGAGGFGAATNFGLGTDPISVAVGDFNGDGRLDLATANGSSNDASVLLGDGSGGFGAASNFAAGNIPFSVAVGDFDDNGAHDLAVANQFSNDVSVLLGDGAGGFGAATNFAVGTNPLWVAVGDFNSDGNQDLATANSASNSVSVLLGDGAGGFSAATDFAAGTSPASVAVGDYDGDGDQDLAVANANVDSVSVLLGDGAGGFGAATNFATGTNPQSVAVGDFNGDGKPDFATANVTSNDISVLLNNCAAGPPAITVNSTADTDNGACEPAGTNNGCTLREAINASNATAGTVETIAFSIAGSGVQTIAPTSALPTITDPVIIDGYTQPGASANTLAVGNDASLLIELNGAGAGAGVNGLRVSAGNSTVRGLVINRFTQTGVRLETVGGNIVTGNFIGTDAAGTADLGNASDGVFIFTSSNNTIGGTTPAARNLISGNNSDGIDLTGNVSNNVISGNYIGTNAAGTAAIGNTSVGVILGGSPNIGSVVGGAAAGAGNLISGNNVGVQIGGSASDAIIQGNFIGTSANGLADLGNTTNGIFATGPNTQIGGTTTAARNVIAGNNGDGILISGGSSSAIVQGNFIGVAADGATALGNSLSGVHLVNSSNNQIGGTLAGAGNLIAFNATNNGDGVEVSTGNGNAILSNSIFSNGTTVQHLGIDLGLGGVTANDAGDADTGANNLQNFPVLASATAAGSSTTITGTFNSTPSTNNFRLEFFSNAACDTAGNGEGRTFLGSTTVNTDGAGNATINTTLMTATTPGEVVTATATDAANNTSEFSQCVAVVAGAATFTVTNTADAGAGSLRQAITDANANAGLTDTIAFNIAGAGPHTITPTSPLPIITDPVIIDGYTQPGSSANTLAVGNNAVLLIQLNGVSAGVGGDGLRITAGGSTVRGLVINRFSDVAIELSTNGGNTVTGNFIGTNPAGTASAGTQQRGIRINNNSTANTVGGSAPAARNLISGNNDIGIDINGAGTANNLVRGNYVGTNAAGSAAIATNQTGIELDNATNNQIGGTAPGEGNLLSGNASSFGLLITGSNATTNTTGTIVQGNFIGTNATGMTAVPNFAGIYISPGNNNTIGGTTPAARNIISGNGSEGILIGPGTGNLIQGNFIGANASGNALGNTDAGIFADSSSNTIGGTAAGAGNLIAFNGLDGVASNRVTISGNAVLGNSIHSNGTTAQHLGIDLGADGVTPNDAGDPDTGANNLQNFPVLASAMSAGGTTTINGTFNSTPSTNNYRIEFFSNAACDTSGNGEGRTFLGSTTVNTDGSGNATINTTLMTATVAGEFVTATATDAAGNTSEFSQCVAVMAGAQTFTVTNTSDAGAGSLRQAITDANANAGQTDTIQFNIPGSGVQTISPLSALPDITDPVIIDGYTQPGSSINTLATGDDAVILIELNGAGAGAGVNGLSIAAAGSGSTVRGLAINRFTRDGISLNGSDNCIITGNFIGTDTTGLVDLGNGSVGIEGEFFTGNDNNTIGGTTPAARNIISGNASGIEFGAVAANNIIQGNFIGLGADGTTSLGNTGFGVVIGSFTSANVIGGDDAADGTTDGIVHARNYISGNGGSGIMLGGPVTIQGNHIGTDVTGTLARPNNSGIDTNLAHGLIVGGNTAGAGNLISGNTFQAISVQNTVGMIIKGNRIGTQADGVSALGNGGFGIFFNASPTNTQIGGSAAGEGNVIAFNGGDGVQIDAGTGNSILSNSIHSNGTTNLHLGIDLGADGVTPNDANDADTGPNNLQNFPVLASAMSAGGTTTINGTFNSTPSTNNYRLEFFSNAACDTSGNGEGRTFLGSTTVNTDAGGNATINTTLMTATVAGEFVTATATDAANNTSEFSSCVTVANASQTFTVTNTNDSGAGSLRQAVLDSNANAGADTIVFDTTVFNVPRTITLTSGNLVITNSSGSDVTITGPGASLLTVSGNNNSKIFSILETPVVTISEMTLTQGNGVGVAPGNTFGGAIYNQGTLTVNNLVITGNSAGTDGGGIYVSTSDSLTVNNCTVTNNTAAQNGGGIYVNDSATASITNTVVSGNTAQTPSASAGGGGIYADTATFTLTDSTVSGNTSNLHGGGLAFDIGGTNTITRSTISGNIATNNGGGLFLEGTSLTVMNSTISGNSAAGGGGVHRTAGGAANAVVFSYSTIAGNTASANGGGVEALVAVAADNTLVGNNSAGGAAPDYAGTLNSQGHNLVENTSGTTFAGTTTGNVTGVDPNLGPLANNGGPTQTHLPLTGSPAIDAANPVTFPATDQRGSARPTDGNGDTTARPDIGAVEAAALVLTLTVTNTNDSGAGSLRQAITDSNNTAGVQTIAFNIPGSGVQTISPASALPTITDPVIIDGYTQPGASANTNGPGLGSNAVILIELNGAGAGAGVNGLSLVAGASGSTVRGLAINRFTRDGISLNGTDNCVITGNFLGTDTTGLLDLGNGTNGVEGEFGSNANNNLIGGITPAARNIISGNGGSGITFGFASGNVIQGNFIGLGADGTTSIGNGGTGVDINSFVSGFIVGGDDAADGTTDGVVNARNYISANGGNGIFLGGSGFGGATVQGNFIGTDASGTLARPNSNGIDTNLAHNAVVGGASAGAGNLISGNTSTGIRVGNTTGFIIKGNRIGTQADGVSALGNGGNGIDFIAGSNGTQIGGAAAGEGNRIGFNGGDGVQIDAGTGNSILSNSIHSNGTTANHLGIDLGADGVTPNDANDADTGANNLQNFPVLASATAAGSTTTVTGTFNSTPSTNNFRIEFFSNAACDTAGNGEGRTFLGSTTVNTDGAGNATINATLLTATVVGEVVTATATDPSNNTSEFSACTTVTASGAATDVSWINAAGGNWNVAANWQDGTGVNRVPGASDHAIITLDAAYTVTLNVNATVSQLTLGAAANANTQTLANAAQTLTLNGASTIEATGVVEQTGGLLSGGGTLTVRGVYNWTGGNMNSTGTTAVAAGGTLNIGGTGNRTIFHGSAGSGGRKVLNAGTINWSGTANISSGDGSFITNQPGGLFNIQNDQSFIYFGFGTTPVFNNQAGATLRKSAGAGATNFAQFTLNNTGGVIDVQTGTLTFDNASAAHVFGAGTTITGAGALVINGSDPTFTGTININGTLTLASGNLHGVHTFTGAGVFNWTGGALRGGGAVTTIAAGFPLNISGAADKTLFHGSGTSGGHSLVNNGVVTWTGTGNIRAGDGSAITNQSGALFNAQSDASFIYANIGNEPTFNNQAGAIFRKSGGAGDTTVARFNFTNSGTIDIQTGALVFNDANAAHVFNNGSTYMGAGAVRFAGATVTMNGTQNINTTFEMSSGLYFGTATWTGAGAFNWTGGSFRGTGTTTVAAGFDLNISGAANKSLIHGSATSNGHKLVNNGTIIWTGAGNLQVGDGSTITNQSGALFDIQTDASFVHPFGNAGAFVNQAGATLRKSVGSGVTTFPNNVGLSNAGIIEILAGELRDDNGFTQTAGSITLNGGNLSAGGTIVISGGTLGGVGTVTANVNNTGGTVRPGLSPGCLNITGNYTQGAGGALDIEIGGTTVCTQFDRLAVSGAAALNGTLNLILINGFTPSGGTPFQILTYGSRTGTFSTINGPFMPAYNANDLTVTPNAALPQTFTVTNTNDAGAGSLRQAITDANAAANAGQPDTIAFNIPGSGVQTISPTSALPTITDPVIIDGYTQPGASANTLAVGNNAVILIELNGANAGAGANGLTITAGSSTVRGLVINRFGGDGIRISTNGGNQITGNFIGTDAAGSADFGNTANGLFIQSPNNTVGGSTPALRNLFSGNNQSGISIQPAASNTTVQGNYIGTDAAGAAAIANTAFGVAVSGPNNQIGGAAAGAGNLISGNGNNAVFIFNATGTGNTVRGNRIGTTANGAPLGNVGAGVSVLNGASGNSIGGTAPGEGNVIAFNGNNGVGVGGTGNPSANAILSNSVFSNAALGIDLGPAGVTPNDAGDPDTGANNLQNFPVLTSATSAGGNTTIQGTFNSTPSTNNYRVEFFSNDACDPSGNGEGRTFLGSTTLNTDASGNATFNTMLLSATAVGEVVTATATDPAGNTSEFSACAIVSAPANLTVTNTNDAGAGSLRQAIIDSNNTAGVQTIIFNIPGSGVQTISPTSVLPTITDPVVIDGYTQPGSITNTLANANNAVLLIELNGANAGAGAQGLNLTAGSSTVRGLVINRFQSHGITMSVGVGNFIAGNFIGANVAGSAALGNGGIGVRSQSSANIIGGAAPAERNLISGNAESGVIIDNAATGNLVRGNFIGTDAAGAANLGNGLAGIGVDGASGNTIGGAGAGDGNRIAFNGIAGVAVINGTGNAITGNQIFSNAALGIDLSPAGVTPNDAGDTDTGANNLQNFPVLATAISAGGNTIVTGTLNSTTSTAFRVEFFSNATCDASGNGEGRTFLGSTTVNTDGNGNASINTTLLSATAVGEVVTATATDPAGNTSEFSSCVTVAASSAGTVQFDQTGYTVNESAGIVTLTVTRTGGTNGAVTVAYTDTPGSATTPADYSNGAGTVNFADGDAAPKTFNITINNDALDEPNETFNVALNVTSGAATVGTPGVSTVTITDDDPTPTVSINDASVIEGDSGTRNMTFTVSLSAASGQNVSVNFSTADQTATAGSDYDAATGTANIPAGSTSATFNVVVRGDTLDEPDETFIVNLSNPSNATINDGQGVGTILDDDPTPSLSINDVAVSEGNSGTTAAVFNVTLSAASGQTVTVNFSTADQTATAGTDYQTTTGTLTFNPGETTKPVTVQVIGDTVDEPNETFLVNLSAPVNATLGDAQGVGTIIDDDGAPSLSIGDVSVVEGNSGTTPAVFNVTLLPASGQTVTVNFSTADGTATAGADYQPTSGTLTFNQGETSKTVSVQVIGDTLFEADETFFVNLSNPSNAAIGDAQGVGTITNDDVQSANLSLTKTDSPDPVIINNNLTYTITATNNGPGAASGVTVTDTLPEGVPFVSATASQGVCGGTTTVTCALGNLGNGASATVTIVVRPNAIGNLSNTATVTANEPDPNNANNSATATTTVINPPNVAITGRVADANGRGILGINLTLSGSQTAVTTTDDAGNYSFAGLAAGGNYTVTPSEVSFIFTPASRTFNNLNANQTADFTGALVNINVTGRVTDGGGNGLPGVTLTVSGAFSLVTFTDAAGNYALQNVPARSTFTITPDRENFSFNPPSRTFTNVTTNQTGADFVGTLQPQPTPTPDPSDDFNAPQIDPNKWSVGVLTQTPASFDPLVQPTQPNGQLVITPRTDANGPSFNGYVSKVAVDLGVTSVVGIEVLQTANGPGVQTVFSLGRDQNNFFRFVVEDTSSIQPFAPRKTGAAEATATPTPTPAPQTLSFQVDFNGSKFSTGVGYNPQQHRYWRFRYDAPAQKVFFETSPDRVVWTSHLSSDLLSGQTRLIAEISAGSFGPLLSPTAAIFDNYNVSAPTRLQFASSGFSALENGGPFTVAVTRTGATDSPTTVAYATSDGTATAGSDYTPVSGTLRFEIGETIKTFQIPILDDQLFEGNETINLTLSNVVGGAVGANSNVVLTILDNESSANPIDDSTIFVTQHYRDFLNREPDAAGLQFWVNGIESCGANAQCREVKRIDTSAAFFLSIEFQETGYFAYRIYDASFDRFPLFLTEFLPDSQALGAGVVVGQPGWEQRLANNKRAFAAQFVTRQAFRSRYDALNSADYVDTLFRNAGLTPTEEERTALIAELVTGRRTRADVLVQIVEDPEYIRRETNRAFVLMQYLGYLRRDPDTPGYNFWLNKLNQFNGDFRAAEMVKAFISSIEYRQRFGRP